MKNNKIKLSEDTLEQLENLGLIYSEIKGNVLDVGSGEGFFSKELSKIINSKITSVDIKKYPNSQKDVIICDVKKMPFGDNFFDMVFSHASIPNMFILLYDYKYPKKSEEIMQKSIMESFREMLRVVKSKSPVIMAPVGISKNNKAEESFSNSIKECIRIIRSEGIKVSFDKYQDNVDPSTGEKFFFYRLKILKS